MTLQDDFLTDLRDAAERVGPVAGIDGAQMARRAVRRERVRRVALTGVGGLAAVGAVAGAGLVASPVTSMDPATGAVPAGWTPVSVGGLALAVPPGLDSSADGVWERDDNLVQVQPAGEGMPLAPRGSGLTPSDVDVPGAASAEYVTETWSDPTMVQEFLGKLQVHLESGEMVQVSLVWAEADEGEEVFADLVRSVAVDDDSAALPSPEAPSELRQLEGLVPGVPEGWREAEFAGLEYAVPAGWVEDETAAREFPSGHATRAASADGASSLTILQAADAAGWPDSIAPSALYPAYTFPLDGADVVQVELRSTDGTYSATAKVRREGGRAYLIRLETSETNDARDLALQLVGTLAFASGSETAPGPDELMQLPTSDTPKEWADAHWGDLRLAVPAEWTDTSTSEAGGWTSGPDGATAGESISVHEATVDENGPGWTPPYGYRHDVPGAEYTVIQTGEQAGAEGGSRFVGSAELHRGDKLVSLEYSGPLGGDSEKRFGMLVRSLELAGS